LNCASAAGTVAAVRVVALLKGVNVGGHNKVAMGQLREALAAAGFTDVRTHLQSGNVVLDCPDSRVASVGRDLEGVLLEGFGVSTTVVVRTSEELSDAMASDPLLPSMTDPARHLVGFLSESPAEGRARSLVAKDFGADLIAVIGSHVYMWCPAGLSSSPFFRMDIDRLLGVSMTARNWRTVLALAGMAGLSDP
jgi:uncharacterized protein (DUF1697 family)